jgi:hypothetical protein
MRQVSLAHSDPFCKLGLRRIGTPQRFEALADSFPVDRWTSGARSAFAYFRLRFARFGGSIVPRITS